MQEYITAELPMVMGQDGALAKALDFSRCSITGHSMGGHGALTLGIKYASQYKSVSAFSPICSPKNCPWGQKALSGYLGDADKDAWALYDACDLIKGAAGEEYAANAKKLSFLIDQGSSDQFLENQLKPKLLLDAAKESGCEGNFQLRMQEGYDHSYYCIASFIEDHIEFHASHLGVS